MFIDKASTYSIRCRTGITMNFIVYEFAATVGLPPLFHGKLSKIQRLFFFTQRSQKTRYLMSLFVAGREAVCAVAQIIGGGFSAGEGKLKVTPGWEARHDASFLSALQLKNRPSTVPREHK